MFEINAVYKFYSVAVKPDSGWGVRLDFSTSCFIFRPWYFNCELCRTRSEISRVLIEKFQIVCKAPKIIFLDTIRLPLIESVSHIVA